MTGWIVTVVLAAVVVALVWRFARLPTGGLYLVGAAVTLALFGYQLQGRPASGYAGPREAETKLPEDRAAITVRQQMYGRFNADARWIEFADTMLRLGATRAAVDAVNNGLRASPRSVLLWTALGSTLVAHGRGQISPAALHAFNRAAALDPQSPAPPFFLGLALANAGEGDAAITIWNDLLRRTPADAPWRPELERRLSTLVLARLRAQGAAQAPVAAPPPPVPVEGSGQSDATRRMRN